MSETVVTPLPAAAVQGWNRMSRVSDVSSMERGRPASASPVIGAAAGLVGGLVASWVMVRFQTQVWPAPKGDDGESSTSKLVRRLADMPGGNPLTDEQAKVGGEAIHYALGAGLGLAYGAMATTRPEVATGAGIPFGIATEIMIDQAIVPALGLSNPFWECPPRSHLRGLAAHLLFGLATDASRRLMLRLVDLAAPRTDPAA